MNLTFAVAPAPGSEPQTEKQVEKVSTLGMARRDTALLLRDFRQGASNWIHSLLDSNRAANPPSTQPEATGKLLFAKQEVRREMFCKVVKVTLKGGTHKSAFVSPR